MVRTENRCTRTLVVGLNLKLRFKASWFQITIKFPFSVHKHIYIWLVIGSHSYQTVPNFMLCKFLSSKHCSWVRHGCSLRCEEEMQRCWKLVNSKEVEWFVSPKKFQHCQDLGDFYSCLFVPGVNTLWMGSQPIILCCTYFGTFELIETYLPVTVLSWGALTSLQNFRQLQAIAVSRLSSLSRDCRW